jgi:hydrogenase expression/formation protein HypD
MKYLDEFRDPELVRTLVDRIRGTSRKKVSLMEVCGSHTVAIHRNGLKGLLPPTIRLVSGPGCPVCVTSQADIDRAIALASDPGVIFTTFGDMMRVPGSAANLLEVKAGGGDIRVVYSPADALDIATANSGRKVVFFAAGFETTAPTVAATVLRAHRAGLSNFSVFSVHKLIPPAMRALLSMPDVRIDGFLCPGHVSVIIGADAYRFLPETYGKPAVVTGFEPVDVLQGILMLVEQFEEGRAAVEVQYGRTVTARGNPKAMRLMGEVFAPGDAWWRGLGKIPGSGLDVRPELAEHDARRLLTSSFDDNAGDLPGCSCGEVLKGTIEPEECPLFGGACTPDTPVGPCMVSSEGSCSAHYKYAARD